MNLIRIYPIVAHLLNVHRRVSKFEKELKLDAASSTLFNYIIKWMWYIRDSRNIKWKKSIKKKERAKKKRRSAKIRSMTKWNQQRSLWMESWTNFVIPLLRSSYNYIKYISTNLPTIITPSSLRRSQELLTIRTRSANMEQSRTSKLHTTLSMSIDSSLTYARYILKRKLQYNTRCYLYTISIKSRSIHIDEKFEIDWLATWLVERYISRCIFFFFFYIPSSIKGI